MFVYALMPEVRKILSRTYLDTGPRRRISIRLPSSITVPNHGPPKGATSAMTSPSSGSIATSRNWIRRASGTDNKDLILGGNLEKLLDRGVTP